MDILEELLSLGGLGIQYCIKSKLAYSKLLLMSLKSRYLEDKYRIMMSISGTVSGRLSFMKGFWQNSHRMRI